MTIRHDGVGSCPLVAECQPEVGGGTWWTEVKVALAGNLKDARKHSAVLEPEFD